LLSVGGNDLRADVVGFRAVVVEREAGDVERIEQAAVGAGGGGDRAVFFSIVRLEPLAATVESRRADQAAYDSWQAHFGAPPKE
jgi:hypothetical protein